MKGVIEAMLKDIRAENVRFEGPTGAPSDASYHPGRVATVWAAVTASASSARSIPWWPRTMAWTLSSTALS